MVGTAGTDWIRPVGRGSSADVLGRPIVIPSDPGAGARRAVLVAAEALTQPFDAEPWASSAPPVPGNVESDQAGHAARGWW